MAEMSSPLYSSRILLLFHVSTQTHHARARELNTRKSKQMKNFTEATETNKTPSARDAERIVAECDGDSSPARCLARPLPEEPAFAKATARQGRCGMSVWEMVRWLDREEIAAARERKYRNRMRKLPPELRRFIRVLRHVLEVEPGPENLHREKIMKRLQIGPSRYYELRLRAEKILV